MRIRRFLKLFIVLVVFCFLFGVNQKGHCGTASVRIKVTISSATGDTGGTGGTGGTGNGEGDTTPTPSESNKGGCIIKVLEAVQNSKLNSEQRDKIGNIASVEVTITGEGMADIHLLLTEEEAGYYTAELPGLPAGVQLTFKAEAKDSADKVLYEGTYGITLQTDTFTDVNLTLSPLPTIIVNPPLDVCLSDAPSYTVTPFREENETEAENKCGLGCNVKVVRLGKNFEDIVLYSPSSSLIWPGAIVSALSMTSGMPQPVILLPGYRRPLTVSVLGLSIMDNTRIVEDPYEANVDSAISDILRKNSDVASTPAFINVEFIEAYSREQVGIEAGLTGIFGNENNPTSISAGFDFSKNKINESRSVFIKVVQRYFTVSIRLLPKGYYYLNDNAACSDVIGNLEQGDVPVIINEVVYGRILIYQMSSQREITAEKLAASFKAKVLGVEATEELIKIFESSEKRVLVLGGDPTAAVKIIGSGDAAEFFNVGLRWSVDSPGVPLIYHLRYMTPGLSSFSYGKTTEFQIKECQIFQGDNLWDIKSFARDYGHENNFSLNRDGSPVCGSNSCWGSPRKLGGNDGPGSLNISYPKDSQVYGHTYLYVKQATNLSASFDSDVGRVWLNDVEITGKPLQMHLNSGWNHLEVTCYNQNNTARLAIMSPLADYVDVMDSNGCNP